MQRRKPVQSAVLEAPSHLVPGPAGVQAEPGIQAELSRLTKVRLSSREYAPQAECWIPGSPLARRPGMTRLLRPAEEDLPYFAAAGNAGSLPTSRASCWTITVALRFFASCLMRSIDAMVCERSVLKLGTPSWS